ncbi:FecR domain-containing protein [Pedobacter sp. JCM 36344]|uniref:FecR domain-containing protein n=1 Tax=Pedobacter sp. JCM 36344 TaxID=3374280 RepID=UPI00397E485E
MNRNKVEDLLDRYLKNKTTIDENELVEQWLQENGNPDSEWQQMNRSEKDKWLSNVFVDIKNTVKDKEAKLVIMRPQRRLWYKVAGIAATLIIVSGFYLAWTHLDKQETSTTSASISVIDHHEKQLTLPDGSKVWLNSGAELKTSKAFNGSIREVYLSGEAYFDIAHNAAKPFIIHTGDIVTTVLGTAFNIKEDKSKHTIEVTVARGKVSVADGTKMLGILTPNQQISFDTQNSKAVRSTVDSRTVAAWQYNDIHFDDIRLADAVLELEYRFKVKINFRNEKLKDCRFTGTALKGEKLNKILNVICAFNNATFETMPDGTIMIDGPGCK